MEERNILAVFVDFENLALGFKGGEEKFDIGRVLARLVEKGDIVVKPSGKDLEGYPGYQFGQADESIDPVRKPLDATTSTDAEGNAQVAITLPAIPHTSKPLEANVILRLRETGGHAERD